MSEVGQAGRPEHGIGWRFAFGGTLALAMGIGPLAIYVLSALGPSIISDLDLSRTSFGALATVSYLVTAVLAVSIGTIVDRRGPRVVLMVLFVLGGSALAGIGLADSYAWLLVAVVLSGLTQALATPVTNQVLADIIVPGQRGLLMGAKQSGVQMCQFLAGATLPVIAVALGWRGAALTATILLPLGIVLVASVLRSARMPPVRRALISRDDRLPLPRSVWWIASYSFLIGAGLQATNVHVPLYAFEEVGLSAVLAGGTTGVLGAVGVASRLGWGQLAERLAPIQRPLAIMSLGGVAAATLLYLASVAPWIIWVGVATHGLTAVAANVVTMMAVVRSVDARQIGRASGVLSTGLYLGFAVGPVAFGALADATGGYGTGWLILMGVYLLAAALTFAWSRQDRAHGDAQRPAPAAASADDPEA